MSIKTKFVFQFDEDFLNEHKQLANVNEDEIACYFCLQLKARGIDVDPYFKRGDWIFSTPARKGKQKRRHLRCALRINLAPQKYSKYLNAFYMVSLAVWLAEMGRYFLLGTV